MGWKLSSNSLIIKSDQFWSITYLLENLLNFLKKTDESLIIHKINGWIELFSFFFFAMDELNGLACGWIEWMMDKWMDLQPLLI